MTPDFCTASLASEKYAASRNISERRSENARKSKLRSFSSATMSARCADEITAPATPAMATMTISQIGAVALRRARSHAARRPRPGRAAHVFGCSAMSPTGVYQGTLWPKACEILAGIEHCPLLGHGDQHLNA